MKMDRVVPAIVVSVCLVSGVLSAADWPQWMGPQRSNVAPESPELVDSFAERIATRRQCGIVVEQDASDQEVGQVRNERTALQRGLEEP